MHLALFNKQVLAIWIYREDWYVIFPELISSNNSK